MADCVLECSDVFDERRFYSETIAILRALLGSTATKDVEMQVVYDVQQNGTYVVVYQWITIECDGEVVITYTEADGITPYTPTGTIQIQQPTVTSNVVSHFADVSGDTTIPAGFIHAAVAIESGTADLDGTTFPEGSSLRLPPMSFNGYDRLYPALPITNVTGNVLIYYATIV